MYKLNLKKKDICLAYKRILDESKQIRYSRGRLPKIQKNHESWLK